MDYNKLRKKTNKYYKGVPTFQSGGAIQKYRQMHPELSELSDEAIKQKLIFDSQSIEDDEESILAEQQSTMMNDITRKNNQFNQELSKIKAFNQGPSTNQLMSEKIKSTTDQEKPKSITLQGNANVESLTNNIINTATNWEQLKENGQLGQAFGGMAAQVSTMAFNAVDNLAMGDKNFGAQSQAIDTAVHGASSALMSSGNPYAMIAGAALEGANFLTKAGGQTVQGFDVDINSSGYGNLGHMESSSSRDFGAMIGLGGVFTGNVDKKLAKRNEQAKMALAAANIANEQKFEQEARANAIDNVIQNNQIALAGGLDTSLLGG